MRSTCGKSNQIQELALSKFSKKFILKTENKNQLPTNT